MGDCEGGSSSQAVTKSSSSPW